MVQQLKLKHGKFEACSHLLGTDAITSKVNIKLKRIIYPLYIQTCKRQDNWCAMDDQGVTCTSSKFVHSHSLIVFHS